MGKVVLVFVAGLFLTGCASYYHVMRIPKTPENVQAYRECQRTAATAQGYDPDGYKDLTRRCLNTLDGLTEEEAEGEEGFQKIAPGAECRPLEFISYGGERMYYYYLCSPAGK
ncbi:MAG: hypothetical protein RBR18_12590 [Desulfovibrionaceae bacterium]|nr:hypothetical protein [Desulfovibrionaceae bacterium]